MRVLVACETSGVVRDAFIAHGHEAISCDVDPSESSGPHYQGDIRDVLRGSVHEWDMMIAFPPCTYLCRSGARYWKARREQQREALSLVAFLLESDIAHIAIENPVGHISTAIRKPDQIIHPWQYGHDASKKTCLWLKNLPLLMPTTLVPPSRYRCPVCANVFDGWHGMYGYECGSERPALPLYANQTISGQNNIGPRNGRAKQRSRTYNGIAMAMAEQWGRR